MPMDEHALVDEAGDGAPQRGSRDVEHRGELAFAGQKIRLSEAPGAISRFSATPTLANSAVRWALLARKPAIPFSDAEPLDKRYTLAP